MNVLLAAVLFSQSGFIFYNMPTVVTAGQQWQFSPSPTIVAVDQNGDTFPYDFRADLSTNQGSSYISPTNILFSGGVCAISPAVYLAYDTMRLICTKGSVSEVSNPFQVLVSSPKRYVTLMPGEALTPGSQTGTGRIGTPSSQRAGVPCTLATFLTDNWFNPVGLGRADAIVYSCTDPFAQIPPKVLVNGSILAPATLRRAGTDHIYTWPKVSNGVKADTSSSLSVLRGPFSRIITLLAGETLVPGDTTTGAFATPGKTGGSRRVYVKNRFPVRVIGTDECWNQDTTPADSVTLMSDFSARCSLNAQIFPIGHGGSRDTGAMFKFYFDSTGSNQTLWAYDMTRNLSSLKTMLDVVAKTESIVVTMLPVPNDPVRPETASAGRIVTFTARLLDANLTAIPAKEVRAVVVAGHGEVVSVPNAAGDSFYSLGDTTYGITDSTGTAYIRFQCSNASNNEEDTIEFAADGYKTLRRVYIITDPDVADNRLIAFPNPLGLGGSFATIEYSLPATADEITVAIYDPFGNQVVRSICRRGNAGDINGVNRVLWDGRAGSHWDVRTGETAGGRRVASGVYMVKVWGLHFTDKPYNKTYRLGVLWPN